MEYYSENTAGGGGATSDVPADSHVTEGTRGVLNTGLVRTALRHFFLNFYLEDESVYKSAIRNLAEGAALRLDLEHLAMSHWVPAAVNADDNASMAGETSSGAWNELLPAAFTNYPLRAVSTAEAVVRELHAELTGSKPRLIQLELSSLATARRVRDLSASTMDSLVPIHGIVTQAYRPFHKAVRLVVRCRGCSHRLTLTVPAWKSAADMPRACSAAAASEARCPPNPYVILSEESEYIDAQSVKIQEFPEDVPSGDMARTLMLNCCGVFASRVVPGERIRVLGIHATQQSTSSSLQSQRKGGSHQSNYLHVLGIQPVSSAGKRQGGMTWTFQLEEEFQAMANDPNITERIFQSIAPAIVGLEDIKRSVACLLFGGSRKSLPDGTKLRGDVNVLLLGDPSTAKSQFLKFCERCAPIAVYTSGKGSSAAGLTAAVVRDQNRNFALEGGAMVLADGGVVCIDEFDKMRSDDRVAIHEAMEQQTISLAKAGITTVLCSRCSVLAAANPVFGSYDITKDTTEQHDFETTILSRFDLIWIVKDERNAERDAAISQHIFNLHAGGEGVAAGGAAAGAPPIPMEKLRQYIHYCRETCHPTLGKDAAKKLENFYIEVREGMRGDSRKKRDQIPITVRQLESLVRVAEALAKMSLSAHVGETHVAEAIRLFKLSTVEAGRSVRVGEGLSDAQRQAVKAAEAQILARLAPGAKTSKMTILRDLQHRGFDQFVVVTAIRALVARSLIEERGDATVRRPA